MPDYEQRQKSINTYLHLALLNKTTLPVRLGDAPWRHPVTPRERGRKRPTRRGTQRRERRPAARGSSASVTVDVTKWVARCRTQASQHFWIDRFIHKTFLLESKANPWSSSSSQEAQTTNQGMLWI